MSWGAILLYAFVGVTCIQIFYYLYFFRRVAFYKPTFKDDIKQHPVSVIICARDEAAALTGNLPEVLAQEYAASCEVIVVNDNSYDESQYILEAFQKENHMLQVVNLTQEAKHITGKKYPLSVGIKEARNEVLLLSDADCVPASQHWLLHMQNAFDNGVDIALGYGAYTRLPGFLNKVIRFETFHTAIQYLGYALAGKPYMGVGRNLAYKRELFFKNKGFSSINHIASGDDDLFINQVANKQNTSIVIDKEAFTFSTPKTTWREWRRQKTRHYSTGKFYKTSHQFWLGLYTFSLLLFYSLMVLSLVFSDWRYALIPFGVRLLIQGVIWHKAMKKLGEEDLFWLYPFWDVWQVFYYLYFAAAVWKKPKREW